MSLPKIRKDFVSIIKESDKAILFKDFDGAEHWIPRSLISFCKKRTDEQTGRKYVSAVIAAFKFEDITGIQVEEMDKVFIPSGGVAHEEFCTPEVTVEWSKAVPFYYSGQIAAVNQGIGLKYQALFCDPRSGKTLISLTIANARLRADVIDQVVIVCPASLQENWRADIMRYFPEADTSRYTVLSLHSMSFDSSMEKIVAKFNNIGGRKQLIYDESHLVKNHSAKRTRNSDKYFSHDFAMVLTGTEVERSLADTYHQYGLMSKSIIGSANYNQFAKNFMLFGGRDGEQIVAYQNTKQFGKMVSPITAFLRLHELDPEIPVPVETTEYYDMSGNQREAYKKIENLIDVLTDKNGWMADNKRYQINSLFAKISTGYIPTDEELTAIFGNLGKLGDGANNISRIKSIIYDEQNTRLEVLKRIITTFNEPVVIWCVYKDEIHALRKLLPEAAIIEGGMGAKRVSEVERDFQNGKTPYVICNEAMSLGFTLSRANLVVFFNAGMSRTQRFQSIRRSMLLGKHEQVRVIDIVARRSFDERVREILKHKEKIGKVFRNENENK
ncbi:MAG: DEAD/DEAH box helicase [Prevotellaceae bacterium]|jgi:SNF2 family DNA or RNA helicase|nr:DEAD/DEAH box helicase [Prevotellaceae bacterium]